MDRFATGQFRIPSASRRSHQSLKMTMTDAHLSPAFLSAEVSLLDPPPPPTPPPAPNGKGKNKRASKGQSGPDGNSAETEVPDSVKEVGCSGWIRTSNPPVNSVISSHLLGVAWSCRLMLLVA